MVEKRTHTIIKVLNHNTVICKDALGEDQSIYFGKGIGFRKNAGDTIELDDSIPEGMIIMEKSKVEQYKELTEKVNNQEIIDAVQTVCAMANEFFNGKVSSNLQITLLDHINFAIERKKQNIEFTYPFLNELKYIYPNEYEFSYQAVDYFKEHLKESIPENEIGFMVLHIHAAIEGKKVSTLLLHNQIVHECVKIIEEEIGISVDSQSMYYSRFTNHIEYAIYRTKNNIKIENVMLDSIKEKCMKEYEVAVKIGEHLKSKYYLTLNDDELGYLALHINNFKLK